jgi:hypothetical protein
VSNNIKLHQLLQPATLNFQPQATELLAHIATTDHSETTLFLILDVLQSHAKLIAYHTFHKEDKSLVVLCSLVADINSTLMVPKEM